MAAGRLDGFYERGLAPWDPKLFDLKIPTGTTGIEGSVDLICDAITRDALRPTDRSIAISTTGSNVPSRSSPMGRSCPRPSVPRS